MGRARVHSWPMLSITLSYWHPTRHSWQLLPYLVKAVSPRISFIVSDTVSGVPSLEDDRTARDRGSSQALFNNPCLRHEATTFLIWCKFRSSFLSSLRPHAAALAICWNTSMLLWARTATDDVDDDDGPLGTPLTRLRTTSSCSRPTHSAHPSHGSWLIATFTADVVHGACWQ